MESKTLWMGAIQPHWDQAFIQAAFKNSLNEDVNVKIFRKQSYDRPPIGYAFIEFKNIETAKYAKTVLRNKLIPGTTVLFHLNWSVRDKKRLSKIRDVTEHSMFVGDLGEDVTDDVLLEVFRRRFVSCTEANVVIDPVTGQSKKYGFVRFGSFTEFQAALACMNGVFVGSRAIRVGYATSRKQQAQLPTFSPQPVTTLLPRSTVTVKNVGTGVPPTVLRGLFALYGSVLDLSFEGTTVVITYSKPEEAYRSAVGLNGKSIGGSNLVASLGSVTTPKQYPSQYQIFPSPSFHYQSYQEMRSFNFQGFTGMPLNPLNYQQLNYYGFSTPPTSPQHQEKKPSPKNQSKP